MVSQQCCLALPNGPIFGSPTPGDGRYRKNDPDSDSVNDLRWRSTDRAVNEIS